MQENVLAYKKLKYCKHIKEKTTRRTLCTKVRQEKIILLFKKILFQSTKGQSLKYLQEIS
jgi:hypothetical protein